MAFYLVLSSQPAVLIQSLEFALGTGGMSRLPSRAGELPQRKSSSES